MKKIRINQWINGGWVVLTVCEGQPLTHHVCERHEEGWSSESNQWTLLNGTLYLETYTDGVDCDGRLSRSDQYMCPVHKARDYLVSDGTRTPEWEVVSERQRDYSAESMGY